MVIPKLTDRLTPNDRALAAKMRAGLAPVPPIPPERGRLQALLAASSLRREEERRGQE